MYYAALLLKYTEATLAAQHASSLIKHKGKYKIGTVFRYQPSERGTAVLDWISRNKARKNY